MRIAKVLRAPIEGCSVTTVEKDCGGGGVPRAYSGEYDTKPERMRRGFRGKQNISL